MCICVCVCVRGRKWRGKQWISEKEKEYFHFVFRKDDTFLDILYVRELVFNTHVGLICTNSKQHIRWSYIVPDKSISDHPAVCKTKSWRDCWIVAFFLLLCLQFFQQFHELKKKYISNRKRICRFFAFIHSWNLSFDLESNWKTAKSKKCFLQGLSE